MPQVPAGNCISAVSKKSSAVSKKSWTKWSSVYAYVSSTAAPVAPLNDTSRFARVNRMIMNALRNIISWCRIVSSFIRHKRSIVYKHI